MTNKGGINNTKGLRGDNTKLNATTTLDLNGLQASKSLPYSWSIFIFNQRGSRSADP
jgi:hypothetical protein